MVTHALRRISANIFSTRGENVNAERCIYGDILRGLPEAAILVEVRPPLVLSVNSALSSRAPIDSPVSSGCKTGRFLHVDDSVELIGHHKDTTRTAASGRPLETYPWMHRSALTLCPLVETSDSPKTSRRFALGAKNSCLVGEYPTWSVPIL